MLGKPWGHRSSQQHPIARTRHAPRITAHAASSYRAVEAPGSCTHGGRGGVPRRVWEAPRSAGACVSATAVAAPRGGHAMAPLGDACRFLHRRAARGRVSWLEGCGAAAGPGANVARHPPWLSRCPVPISWPPAAKSRCARPFTGAGVPLGGRMFPCCGLGRLPIGSGRDSRQRAWQRKLAYRVVFVQAFALPVPFPASRRVAGAGGDAGCSHARLALLYATRLFCPSSGARALCKLASPHSSARACRWRA